jgi:hypothetical protein
VTFSMNFEMEVEAGITLSRLRRTRSSPSFLSSSSSLAESVKAEGPVCTGCARQIPTPNVAPGDH